MTKPATIPPAAIRGREAAAVYIGCSQETLRYYESEGLIAPRRHGVKGRGLVYLVTELDALLDALPTEK